MYSKIDLRSSYHQLRVQEGDVSKTGSIGIFRAPEDCVADPKGVASVC